MKRNTNFCGWVALTLTLLLCISGIPAAGAEDTNAVYQTTGRLEVHGQAIRTVMPDTVSLSIGATVQDKDQQVAMTGANTIIADVIEALQKLGVPEGQIKTSRMNISPRYDYTFSTRRLIGYTANVALTVTVKDFELVNAVIDTAVAKGANDIGSMQFSFSEENLAYRQALIDAVMVAREKAEAMAVAAGAELGTLLSLRENSRNTYAYSNSYAPMEAAAEDGGMSGGAQVMAGEIQISASVDLVYETR